jgi:hypothetical protein
VLVMAVVTMMLLMTMALTPRLLIHGQVSGHFMCEVSDTIFPILKDHQFGQQILMPGMAFVEVSTPH